ncbi:MAG: hypothetical protein PHZ19_03990 [Candidatus Thermoplasmatota archaeon]|nr:hypothetical protein [Candidatus Thermoplasmatota archaeon]
MPQDNATRQRPYWLRVNVTDHWLQFSPPDTWDATTRNVQPLWIPLNDDEAELRRLAQELEAAADRLRGIAEERETANPCRGCSEVRLGCVRDCEIMDERRRAREAAPATFTTGDCIPEVASP